MDKSEGINSSQGRYNYRKRTIRCVINRKEQYISKTYKVRSSGIIMLSPAYKETFPKKGEENRAEQELPP